MLRIPQIHKMVNQFHYRPAEIVSVPWVWGYHSSRQSANNVCKVVSPTHRPPLTHHDGNIRGTNLCQSRTVGLYQWKIPATPSGIETSTFRPVAHCKLRHSVYPWINCHQNAEPINFPVCGIYIYHSTLDGNFSINFKLEGPHGEAVSWGTALQARRSRVRIPIVSL